MLTANAHWNISRGPVILFLGAPGSGKGTQSTRLAAQLGVPCLSTGDVLRSEAKRNTPAGFRLRQVLASGSLASDEMVCDVVEARLRRETPDRGLVFDGFPRTVRQASFLDSLLADLGLPRPEVIHLDVSAHGLLRRLKGRRQCAKCGAIYNLLTRPSLRGSRCENDGGALTERDDDTEMVIRRRLAEFETLARPLFAYYGGPDFHRIDGDRDPDSVAADLIEIVSYRTACVRAYGD